MVGALLWPGPLAARVGLPAEAAAPLQQEVSARAYLEPAHVGLSQLFVLNVEISGTQQVDSEPVLPEIGDFAHYQGRSTSTSIQMANGSITATVTYKFNFVASEEGVFEIGPVTVSVGGQTLQTEAVQLMVSVRPRPLARQRQSGGGAVADNFFVEAEVGKRQVFENEPLPVQYRLFFQGETASLTRVDLPLAEGFRTEDLEPTAEAQIGRIVRDGQEYATAVIRRVVLFPVGSGEKVLDPLTVEAQVQRRSRDPFADIFRRSGLFGRSATEVARTPPVNIEVLPLPEAGQPDSFQGHVGELAVTASVDRASVATNEALTFSVELSGTGNVRSLPAPEVTFPTEFEVFPPEISERIGPGGGSLAGSRTFDYVLVPRMAGSLTLPQVEVAYFALPEREYRVARSDPVAVTVTGTATTSDGITAGDAVSPLREEIRFIHLGPTRFRRTDLPLHSTPRFWMIVLGPLIALAGSWAARRRRDRFAGDVAFARKRRASRVARKRLAKARRLASGDPRVFYAEVAGALHGFVADRLNVAEASLVRDEVAEQARRRGVTDETFERLFACLDDCDKQRFAPSGYPREKPQQVLRRATTIMSDLAREMSR